MAAFISTLLLLGIVAYSAGWVAAGNELGQQNRTDPTTSAQPSRGATTSPSPVRSSSPPNSPTPDASVAVTPTRKDAFPMPNLVGQNFLVARQTAIEKKLGVNVVFNKPSPRPDGTVAETFPEAGVDVWAGLTIRLEVAGPPPKVSVPNVVSRPCEEGSAALLDAGLKIKGYPSGRRGNVVKVEPVPYTTLVWNDEVTLFCS